MRAMITLLVAVLMGIVVVVLMRGVLSSPQSDSAEPTGTVPILVAAGPIDRGQALDARNTKIIQFPAGSAPTGGFAAVDALMTGEEPRRALRPLAANEPILADRISGVGARFNLSAMMTPGMRAVSLRVNDVTGVGGFVLPGDRVDVILTRAPDGDTDAITQVLAENALILAVDQSDDDGADKPVVVKAVTVEVTPDEAQTLSLGGVVGTVSLALRKIEDQAINTPAYVTASDLGAPRRRGAGVQQSYAPPPPRAPGPAAPVRVALPSNMSEIRVVRGTEASTYAVGSGG
ncbi:MAG TPA: Flp pilus assembly protein CpaB [Brevundimonas sp.]|nr:Flp pilus assembly protein CpaB [Brevundimonas sp.]